MKRHPARPPRPADMSAWWRHGTKLWEISLATPQVIAHRTSRMMTAGPVPNARDQREFIRMGQEKVEAFGESWFTMGLRLWQAQQAAMLDAMQQGMRLWTAPWSVVRHPNLPAVHDQAARALSSVIGGGMAPVHRRVTANAKRLGRVTLQPSTRKKSP